MYWSHNDSVREDLVQQWVHDPTAWSRRKDKIVFRSEDILGTSAKLPRDGPDYPYGNGTKGNLQISSQTSKAQIPAVLCNRG